MKANKMKIKFIDVEKFGFAVEPRYYFYGWSRSSRILARESAIKALLSAQKLLPRGYNFKIWDAQRPLEVQKQMIKSFRLRLKHANPKLDRQALDKLVFTFCSKPTKQVIKLGTHRNGGSFDLTIINGQGEELYMGTDHDDISERAETDYYEKKAVLNHFEQTAKHNRRLLKMVLEKSGFVNYNPEWWHWDWEE
ncbi:MAG: M15 family metallopeptidase [Patescibacteria group bacterium]